MANLIPNAVIRFSSPENQSKFTVTAKCGGENCNVIDSDELGVVVVKGGTENISHEYYGHNHLTVN